MDSVKGVGYPLVPAVCPALAEPAPPLAKAWLGLPQAMDLWRTDIRKFAPMVLCFPIAPRSYPSFVIGDGTTSTIQLGGSFRDEAKPKA